ncbi:hypothetical protein V1512DRAFT_259126 [Lipomyces arxii]|uniref:uncharacterized protein n=1 Tax=Lipomyces arxii TaxID=56418 RepID=UPI0034CFCCAE
MANNAAKSSSKLDPPSESFLTAAPVSIACLGCRSRHLKCDAGMPICQRCRENGRECLYVKSRRGWKASSGKDSSGSTTTTGVTSQPKRALQVESEFGEFEKLDISTSSVNSVSGNQSAHSVSPVSSPDSLTSSQHPLIGRFYKYFYDAHPVMVPQTFYNALISSQFDPDSHLVISNLLVPVCLYTGSFYTKDVSRVMYRTAVERVVFGAPLMAEPNRSFTFRIPQSPIAVTALLIYAIISHGDGDMILSRAVKDYAIQLALQFNMTDEYALDTYLANSCYNQDPMFLTVMKECLRRTYWMLFVIDGWAAAIFRTPTFALQNVVSNLYLPCEDADYSRGMIDSYQTLKAYDNRVFESPAPAFSSFAYLIDAMRIMGFVMGYILSGKPDVATTNMFDTQASVWFLNLPESKSQFMKDRVDSLDSGSNDIRLIDELMILAYLAIYDGLIVAHKPLSKLGLLQMGYVKDESSCRPPESMLLALQAGMIARDMQNEPMEHSAFDLYTRKCLEAAEAISVLVKMSPATLIRRSPLFTCALNLPLVIQLASCVWVFNSGDKDLNLVKDQVKLGIGALKAVSQVWSIADNILQQVRSAAKLVFEQHKFADHYLQDSIAKRQKVQTKATGNLSMAIPTSSYAYTLSSQPQMPTDSATPLGNVQSLYRTDTDVYRSQVPVTEWCYASQGSSSESSDNLSSTSSMTDMSPPGHDESLLKTVLVNGQGMMEQAAYSLPADMSQLDSVTSLPTPLISEDEFMGMIVRPDMSNDYMWSTINSNIGPWKIAS